MHLVFSRVLSLQIQLQKCMTEKFSQEIPATLQPVATDNCSPVPRPSSEPSQTAGVPEGPAWPSLARPPPFMNGQISL